VWCLVVDAGATSLMNLGQAWTGLENREPVNILVETWGQAVRFRDKPLRSAQPERGREEQRRNLRGAYFQVWDLLL